jgi:hypothetical protein
VEKTTKAEPVPWIVPPKGLRGKIRGIGVTEGIGIPSQGIEIEATAEVDETERKKWMSRTEVERDRAECPVSITKERPGTRAETPEEGVTLPSPFWEARQEEIPVTGQNRENTAVSKRTGRDTELDEVGDIKESALTPITDPQNAVDAEGGALYSDQAQNLSNVDLFHLISLNMMDERIAKGKFATCMTIRGGKVDMRTVVGYSEDQVKEMGLVPYWGEKPQDPQNLKSVEEIVNSQRTEIDEQRRNIIAWTVQDQNEIIRLQKLYDHGRFRMPVGRTTTVFNGEWSKSKEMGNEILLYDAKRIPGGIHSEFTMMELNTELPYDLEALLPELPKWAHQKWYPREIKMATLGDSTNRLMDVTITWKNASAVLFRMANEERIKIYGGNDPYVQKKGTPPRLIVSLGKSWPNHTMAQVARRAFDVERQVERQEFVPLDIDFCQIKVECDFLFYTQSRDGPMKERIVEAAVGRLRKTINCLEKIFTGKRTVYHVIGPNPMIIPGNMKILDENDPSGLKSLAKWDMIYQEKMRSKQINERVHYLSMAMLFPKLDEEKLLSMSDGIHIRPAAVEFIAFQSIARFLLLSMNTKYSGYYPIEMKVRDEYSFQQSPENPDQDTEKEREEKPKEPPKPKSEQGKKESENPKDSEHQLEKMTDSGSQRSWDPASEKCSKKESEDAILINETDVTMDRSMTNSWLLHGIMNGVTKEQGAFRYVERFRILPDGEEIRIQTKTLEPEQIFSVIDQLERISLEEKRLKEPKFPMSKTVSSPLLKRQLPLKQRGGVCLSTQVKKGTKITETPSGRWFQMGMDPGVKECRAFQIRRLLKEEEFEADIAITKGFSRALSTQTA